MPGGNTVHEAKRKKRSHSVASQCSIGTTGQNTPGSRRQSRHVLQEQHSRNDDSEMDYKQRRMVLVISLFAAGLFLSAVLLIVVTLLLTPSIDERIRKENEQLMNSLNRAELESDVAAAVANDAWNSTIAVDPESSPAPLDLQDSKNVSHPSTGD